MKQTCGSCGFSEEIPSKSKKDATIHEEVKCSKYPHKIFPANKANDCMEWKPKKLS